MSLEREVDAAFGLSGESARAGQPSGGLSPESGFSFSPKERNEKRDIGLAVVPVAELLAEPIEETAWLVDGLLPWAGLSILAGKPKAGKSTLARCMALAVARGDPVIGLASVSGPVVYLGLEDKRSEVAAHFRAMGAAGEPLFVHSGPAPRQSARAVEQLHTLIVERRATFAVVDTLLRFVRVREVADYAEMTRALDPLLNLSRETDCHVMAVYHAPKMKREGLDAILGSVAIAGTCDTGLILDRRSNGTRTISAVQRYGADLPDTVLELDEATRMVATGGPIAAREQEQLADAILRVVADEARTEREIREAIGGDTGKVGKVLRELVDTGRVSRAGGGVSGDPYRYRADAT